MTHHNLYDYLTRSHDYLSDVLRRLLEAMAVNAQEVRALWNELDHGLLTHMEAEERFVLPAFGRVDRDEALALLRQHGQFREELFELGIAVDLHYLRYARGEAFAEALERHARREENLLYRWADANLEPELAESTRRRLDTVPRRAA